MLGGRLYVVYRADRHTRHGLARVAAFDRLALLVIRQLRPTSHLHTLRFGAFAALTSAGADQFALELGKPALHSQHQASVRGRGVRPFVIEGAKARALASDRRQRVQEIARRARQSVEARHSQHVALGKMANGAVNATLRLRTSSLVDRGPYSEPVFLWLDMRARRCRQDPLTPAHAQKRDGAIAIFRDITELKWRQDELEAARARAEEASVSKDHFLANMSHELRTPLNAIIGFSEILGDAEQTPRDPAKQREYAVIIHHSGLHLLSVVNSILDLSKIQSGSFDLTPSHFSIGPLVDMCCDMIKLKAEERNIELRRSCPDGLEEVMGDKRACKQILINLLSNAVKFTPDHGRVSISVKVEGDALLILVADSGVGINARDLLRLGNPFFQAQGALDRPFEGTGLGLSIVRGLVGLHGGSLAVASEPDEGTCVQVRLPMDCRAAAERGRTCAKIETIAGYRQGDEQRDLFQQTTVKKIA